MPPFNPDKDIPDLSGKVAFITGGTSGIGREIILFLASHNPAHIYFTGRNEEAGATVVAAAKAKGPNVEVTFIKCDLCSSRAKIRQAIAESFKSDRLDIFIANAGIMATPPGLTEEGFELQWGTNYLSHAVILQLLRPVLLRTAESGADVRHVQVTSHGHNYAPSGGIQFENLRKPDAVGEFARYGQSKLAQILYCKAMVKRYPQITSVAVHPGVGRTGLLKNAKQSLIKSFFSATSFLHKDAAELAYSPLWAATAPLPKLENGQYYEPVGKKAGPSKLAGDEALAEKLWEWTNNELKDVEALL
ncbi:NAD(P)-binding protein [Daldinia caldariorum]|uniref:NAD(P)-binding protein n=1 Tax=Daldinia caldariorum TaxID=326644 RepID=UPI00200891D7|nr:NAD(P)-binding protein [Daldinia caldariorum]KAI1473078.1 NAD(P)-binding protein [Daldinia caldariorum]